MLHAIKWFSRLAVKKEDARLVMTILCRNEIDVIEANIRTHARLGVDAFVVMDNASTDGTREKLAALTKEFDLHVIDQPAQNYQQAKWMTELAHYAREKAGAQWVVNNDADEFWLPEKGSIKDLLNLSDSVVTIERSNMVLDARALTQDFHFSQARWRVNYPICYHQQAQLQDANLSMLFAPLSPKVITNPYGLITVKQGNHRAKHLFKPITARKEAKMRVYHYPFRSWQQFEQNILFRHKLLAQGVDMGDHYRRWAACVDKGTLRAEFEKLVFVEEDLKVLERYGVVVEDERPIRLINNFN